MTKIGSVIMSFLASFTSPLYVHVRPGYREKSADLQGTLKLPLQFYDRISRSHRLCNGNWHAHYFLRARSMAANVSMPQG